MKIKPESVFTGTTPTPKLARLPKASAATGSAAQLERVEAKMKVEASTDKSEVTPLPSTHPMVEMYPFEVRIRRLTPKEIEKYTVRSDQLPTNHSCTARPSLVTIRSSPVTTRSMTKRKISKGLKQQTISGHPSQLLTQQRHTFKVRKHILCRHKHKTYVKCRVKGCTIAYMTFNTVKDLNTHHQIYHSNIVYKCHQCKKIINTLSTWRFHKYCQKPKVYKCDNCNKQFMFRSKLKQHRCKHILQKLFKCFYGGCNRSYKHPQDLKRHTATHQQIKFECEMCDKTFGQKHLLKHHAAVHTNVMLYHCPICNAGFLSTTINYIGIKTNAIIKLNFIQWQICLDII